MPNFDVEAEVYKMVMRDPGFPQKLPHSPIRVGPLAETIQWVLKNHDDYPQSYKLRVPLEAGFQTTELHYSEIEAISKRPDFPAA